jgi:deoxycytidine triphosphate deaminase
VYGINPLQVARYRERHGVSGAKSDAADAHTLADMVRTDAHQLRPVAADSPAVQAVKVVARAHKTLIWERTRQVQRLRHQLRDYFPAALEAFPGLDAPDALELLAKAPDPASAARLTTAQVSAALKRARRRDIAAKTTAIRATLREEQLAQPPVVTAACAAVVRALTAVITALNTQIKVMEGQVEAHFRPHPDAEIIMSQPGLGSILGARVLGEFGDDPHRYATGKARKNYAATSPITRASGKRKTVMARYVHNDRLRDALDGQAFAALNASPGVDPKHFDERSFVTVSSDVCIVPPNSFALARSVEYFKIPRDVLTICVGKSTYARCGIIVNVTPFEPEWEGFVTLEISNTTPLPAKIYANEGLCQIIFFQSDEVCETSYADRKGKYQSQKGIVLPKL